LQHPLPRLADRLPAHAAALRESLLREGEPELASQLETAEVHAPCGCAIGSPWAIGPTRAGRFVTVVVERDIEDHGCWHVRTAWESTPAQVVIYRRAR